MAEYVGTNGFSVSFYNVNKTIIFIILSNNIHIELYIYTCIYI